VKSRSKAKWIGKLNTVFKKILTVCVGNICRSPTAELLFRQSLINSEIEVASAGIGALVDKPMDETASSVLYEHTKCDASNHKARQLSARVLHWADLVLVMERDQMSAISRIAPETSGKVFLLGKWNGEREIPDPYRQQRAAFEHVYALIKADVSQWLIHL
jgi:protein-tyrosine phosphatase